MVLHMTRPTRRSDSSFHQFRKRVPADIQQTAYGRLATIKFPAGGSGEPAIAVQATLREHVKCSLQTRDPITAKERTGVASAQLERLYSAIRNGPRALTHKEVVALAGLAYEGFARGGEDDPGPAAAWARVVGNNQAAAEGAYGYAALMIGDKRDRRCASLEERFGAMADALLTTQGIVTDAASRWALIEELQRSTTQAAEKLQRNADGDYRPDPDATRFPAWQEIAAEPSGPTSKGNSRLTFDDLFERWRREREPSPSTVTTWRGYVRKLQKHVGHDDPSRVTKADIVAWKDALVAASYTRKGIKDGQLAAAKALFAYAVDNDLLPMNPALGIKLQSKRSAGSRMQPYSDAEVARLLALADKETKPYRRWLPWLMALSGARVGEVAQLWGNRIIEVDGVMVMQIAPAEDGGSLKNEGSERQVPIHPAILQGGFLDFARAKGNGPLFYRGSRKGGAKPAGRRHASKGVANHLAAWIRENGFTDRRKAPNHAFRHWFKTACQRAGVLDSIADAIQGHSGSRGEADGYRHSGVAVMNGAIRRIPVPK
jgi:integrase